jgi:two-component system sensor histidine kinase TctE
LELAANLIENAVLYTDAGGQVLVSVSNGERANLSVRDNGPGIPLEERSRVFERFYRVLGSQIPGSGLGLSIVKEIAVAHDAEIQIDFASNVQGTLISVSFPNGKVSEGRQAKA